ncbi:barstar family protein [Streptomyces sp. HU2014]|uniref:barstar family protein n=1 Tax=Streptomyces sp. HU2014 TaxID=2939414 RepID=UPI00201081F5|nr:barstar family protein [Streptomyces sp. HU2014]UQI43274.1 barstar family protein [Streptomyces sp. HU2014]
MSGLFVDLYHWPYRLIGCDPAGPLREALAGGSARLGDIWVAPRPDELCPEGSERIDPWPLRDVRVVEHRPHPADASLWDIVIEGADDHLKPPDDPYFGAGLMLHDEYEPLGTCVDFEEIDPPDDEPEPPPLRLIGCAPGAALQEALATGTRSALRLGEARLVVLDRTGAELADRYVTAEVAAWRPSALGPGLIDVDLTNALRDPVPALARPLWERRIDGCPTEPDTWAGYGTSDRQAWLDLVRESGCRGRATPDRAAGTVHRMDGRHITDAPGLYLALGEAVNGPGGYFGGCLAAVRDCLRGNFGATAPFTLVWEDSGVARRSLARMVSPQGERYSYFDEMLLELAEGRVEVILR